MARLPGYYSRFRSIRQCQNRFSATDGVFALGAQHGGEFLDTAVSFQRFDAGGGPAVGLGLADVEMYVAITGQLRQVGDHDDLMVGNGRSPHPSPLFTPQTYCQADLAQPDAADTIAHWLENQGIHTLDLLIHNAGTGYFGALAAQPLDQIDELLTINLHSPIAITHRLFPWLQKARGQVVFVSSVATAVPTPKYAVYGASKMALEGFARSLRVEWQGR